jgi:tetratricopeptide (TPR) repeat protein
MSLLLDALKRAEQEKLARLDPEAPPGETTQSAAKPSLRAGFELEQVERPPVAAPAPKAAREPDRDSAKAVFAAKKAEPVAAPSGRNKAILGIGVVALLLFAGGGAYVWYEINRTPAPLARTNMQVASPKPVIPAPASTPAARPSLAAGAGEASVSTPSVSAPRPENLAAATATGAAAAPEATPKPKPPPSPSQQLVASVLQESGGPKPAPALELTRKFDAPRVPVDVRRGYEALKGGDAAAARGHYESAVAADPANVDAHLGLASAAARTGDRETAARHYRRSLELDPRNPAAVAGLAAIADFSRPDALERQLRADITRHSEISALHFTLGNLLASQGRWNEAQAAYFEAYRLDPGNADQAYNLAVSLDQLGQASLAAGYYQRAMEATGQQPAQFDKEQVARRIAELKR